MDSMLEKKFVKIWQSLKRNAAVKSSTWFKKADTSITKKVEAYQEALAQARSGLVQDLLKFGKTLCGLEEAFVKFADANDVGRISDDDMKKADKRTLSLEIDRFKSLVQHERAVFESRLRSALSAAGNDPLTLESTEPGKKQDLWKGFGIKLEA